MSELTTEVLVGDFVHAAGNPRYQLLLAEVEDHLDEGELVDESPEEKKEELRSTELVIDDVGRFIEEAKGADLQGDALIGKLNLLNNLYELHYLLYRKITYLTSDIAHG